MLRTFICQDDYRSRFGAKKITFNSSQFYVTPQKFKKGTFICQDDYLLKANSGQKKSVLTAHSFMLLLQNSRNADLRAINMVHLIYLGLAVYL